MKLINNIPVKPYLILLLVFICISCKKDEENAPSVSNIDISPETPVLTSIGETIQLKAIAKDAGENIIKGKRFVWSSSDESIASINENGLVTANAKGTVRITATTDNISGSTNVSIEQHVSTILITPNSHMFVSLGETKQFNAVPMDANGNVVRNATISWKSSNIVKASVHDGLVTALRNGIVTISVNSGEITESFEVEIDQKTNSLSIIPEVATISLNSSLQLEGIANDALGNEIKNAEIVWSSSDESIAEIDPNGLITPLDSGAVIIKASSDGKTAMMQLTVENLDDLIIPGKGTLGINLTDNFFTLTNKLGEPDLNLPVAIIIGPNGSLTIYAEVYKKLGFTAFILSKGKLLSTDPIFSIELKAPFAGKTKEQIGIGSQKDDVFDIYGNPDEISPSGIHRYESLGIGFKFDSDDKIEVISIFTPAAGNRIEYMNSISTFDYKKLMKEIDLLKD
ncbi:Ig-like domain-containing protein [Fulvivirgaceae bacterium BMA10]|uniref:Ig-like domain-containing protein n=1 Tax=Splendidivirga corallicola TaxID=3051826 RepID=A0ABT8KM95_9BACT|nr:Ig-like domain-containing protein [Fulvivirgaceae bacterium BMA10]